MLRRCVSTIVLALLVAGCGSTTYDASRSTTAPTETSVQPLPSGDTNTLLAALRTELEELSSYIGPRPDGVPRPEGSKITQLDYIERIWRAVSSEIVDSEAAATLERMVDLARTAVERNRPADADKAAKFAGQVIDELAPND